MPRSSRFAAATAALAVLASSLVAFTIATPEPAVAAPVMGLSVSGDNTPVLAGAEATYTLTAQNAGDQDGFNLAFVIDAPIGVDFVSSPLGAPRMYDSSPLTDPDDFVAPIGYVRWVWQDVADLPEGAAYALAVTVKAQQPVAVAPFYTNSTSVFPVGSSYTLTSQAFLSSNATLLPAFGGSTGKETNPAVSTIPSSQIATTTPITAITIDKDEPSPEADLLRGVHDQTTVYTLTVTNNDGFTTEDATVVDYLPANLEFLGCGAVDNTATGVEEYPGSGRLGSAALATLPGAGATGCLLPESVETIQVTAPSGGTTLPGRLPVGVYTKVTWSLGDLPAGSVTRLQYRAGVPLYENTMTWPGATPALTPAGAGQLAPQAANLDNNTGASTRQGTTGTYTADPARSVRAQDDGRAVTNRARVDGQYQGVVRVADVSDPVAAEAAADAQRGVFDEADETARAMDLRVVKSVATSAGTGGAFRFVPGEAARFTLEVAGSEYTTSEDVVLTDTVGNGLCPLVPSGTPTSVTGAGTYPSECLPGQTAPNALYSPVSNATVTGVVYESATGRFTMTLVPTFAPTAGTLADNGTRTITYPVLMRGVYQEATEYGPTTSGDSFVNSVEITGETTIIDDLTSLPTELTGAQDVWDDSGVTVGSSYTSIDKDVLVRDAVDTAAAAPCAAAAPGDWVDGDADGGTVPTGFRMGDTVCYRLSVTFPTTISTRNPIVTDFLPAGMEYLGYNVTSGQGLIDSESNADGRLEWKLGAAGVGGDLYVDPGSRFVALVWARVAEAPKGVTADKPQNLLKYRQENVVGDVFFLRDAAAFERSPQRVSLIKGVQSVDGVGFTNGLSVGDPDRVTTSDFDSDFDGLPAKGGDPVVFRIDLTGPESGVSGLEVWDALPEGIDCSTVSGLAGATCSDDVETSLGERSVIRWTGQTIPAAVAPAEHGYRTLTYVMTIPNTTSVEADLVNTASVVAYNATTNVTDDVVYYPADSLDSSRDPDTSTLPEAEQWNIPGDDTVDESDVFLPAAQVAKSVTSTVATNNSAAQLVPGEVATYTYSVTVPAGTSVHNGTLVDTLPSQLTRTATPATAVMGAGSPLPAGVTLDTTTGELDFGALYTNATALGQTFTVTIEAYLNSTATNNQTVTNTATFTSTRSATSTDTYSHSATATVTARFIAPTVTKWVSRVGTTNYGNTGADTDTRPATAGQLVTYTVRVANGGTLPTAYDTVMTDCVPTELILDLASAVAAQGTVENPTTSSPIASDAACAGTRLVWQVGTLAPGASVDLTYQATVSATAGGLATYTNKADLTAYSLPAGNPSGYRQEADSDNNAIVQITGATIVKSGQNLTTGVGCGPAPAATECRGAVGDSMRYTITVTLPSNVWFYDAILTDQLPAGVSLTSASIVSNTSGLEIEGPTRYTNATTYATSTPLETTSDGTGARNFVWRISDPGSTNDVASQPTQRTFTITTDGVVTATNATAPAANATLTNTAVFRWHSVDNDTTFRATGSATRAVRVLAPNPAIAKVVNGSDAIDVLPGGSDFTYTVTISNPNDATGTASTAYDLDVVDTVPAGVELTGAPTVTVPATTPAFTPVVATGTTTTITSAIESLAVGGVITISYPARTVGSRDLVPNAALTNLVRVTEYWSNDEANPSARRYAPAALQADAVVTPRFPVIGVTKTTSAPVAYIGVSTPFTITAANTGQAPAMHVGLSDTLPNGWEYVAGTARVAGVATEPTIVGQVLSWGDVGTIAASGTRVVTYDARPVSPGAWDAATTGQTTASYTNTVVATAVDGSGATGNGGASLATTADDNEYTATATATATINRADLAVTKTHTGSTVAGSSTGVTYAIGVSNAGPDPAVGPIVVRDVLPDDVVFRNTTGTDASWVVSGPDASGVLTFTRAATLAVGASAPAIRVTVDLPSDLAPGTTVTNETSVSGATFEAVLTNNSASDSLIVTAEADVTVDKNISATTFVAGEDAVWTIDVTNHGPSTSRGTLADPIVVTDTLPAGVDAGSIATGTDWSCTTSGTTSVTCEYPHDLLVGATAPRITLTTPVSSSKTGTLSNRAVVTPVTPQGLNTRTDSDTAAVSAVGADADLAITKTTVVGREFPAGGVGRYRIEVTNNGPSDAVGVFVTDPLPTGLHYDGGLTSDTTRPWTCTETVADPAFVRCELGTAAGVLTPGESTWFEFDVAIDSSVAGVISNTATVDSLTDDTVTTNDTSTADVTARLDTELVIDKATTATVLDGGDVFTYTIDVENTDRADAANVVVTDQLPATLRATGVTTASGTPAWDCSAVTLPSAYGASLSCELAADLPAGANAPTLTIEVEVAAEAYSPAGVTNAARVEWTDKADATVVYDDDDSVTNALKWIHYDGSSVCRADVAWYDFEFTTSAEVDQSAPITIEWYKDSDGNGVPEAATDPAGAPVVDDPTAVPVSTMTIDTTTGEVVTDGPYGRTYQATITGTGASRTITGSVLWPGAEVDADGVGVSFPGYRVALPGETPTFENLIEDPTVYGANLRAGALVRMSVNPTTSIEDVYPAATAACVVARAPGLAVTKTADVTDAGANDVFTYTLGVASTDLGATDDVVLTDVIPADLKVLAVTPDASTDATVPDWNACVVTGQDARGFGGELSCQLGGWLGRDQVAPDVLVQVQVAPESEGRPIVNTAVVGWTDPDDPSLPRALRSATYTVNAGWLAAAGVPGLLTAGVVVTILLGLGVYLAGGRRRRGAHVAG